MIIVFRNETHSAKLNYVGRQVREIRDQNSRKSSVRLFYNFFACDTWMCRELGEGKEEVENHGRSRVKVSSQETDLKGQWSLRMRANEADRKRAVRQEIVKQFSTGCTLDSNFPPHFSSFNVVSKIGNSFVARRRRSGATLFSSRLGLRDFRNNFIFGFGINSASLVWVWGRGL